MKDKIFSYLSLILILITFSGAIEGQGLENLDNVTGYKNFTLNSTKNSFKNYNLKVYDDSFIGFEKEYGTDPYIIQNYNSIKEKTRPDIYEKAFEDFSKTKPQEITTNQGYNIGDKIESIPPFFELLGVSSKDNSKIYRLKSNFPSTVFSFKVDKFEIKVWNSTIVSLHFVLFPKDNLLKIVPLELLEKIKAKSGTSYFQKESKYFFDENEIRTVVFRESNDLYGGDKVHINVFSSDYLYK